jgi:hypothetical protein
LLVGHEGHYLDNIIDNCEWQCFVTTFSIAEPRPTTDKLFFVGFEVLAVVVMKSSGM